MIDINLMAPIHLTLSHRGHAVSPEYVAGTILGH